MKVRRWFLHNIWWRYFRNLEDADAFWYHKTFMEPQLDRLRAVQTPGQIIRLIAQFAIHVSDLRVTFPDQVLEGLIDAYLEELGNPESGLAKAKAKYEGSLEEVQHLEKVNGDLKAKVNADVTD